MLIAVVAGQPVIVTSNFTEVGFKVTVAVPAQLASASVIGGFSFDAFRSALKTFATVGDGLGVGLAVGDAVGVGVETAAGPPQAATKIAAAAMPANKRIFDPPCGFTLVYARPHYSDDEAEQACKHGFCRGRSSLSSGGHPPPLAAYPGTARATPWSPYAALLQVALARFTPLARVRHCGAGLASRRRGVTPYLALWSPDFPRRLAPTRPPGLLGRFILPRFARTLVRVQRARHFLDEPACSSHVLVHRDSGQLPVVRVELLAGILASELAHVLGEVCDIDQAAPEIRAAPFHEDHPACRLPCVGTRELSVTQHGRKAREQEGGAARLRVQRAVGRRPLERTLDELARGNRLHAERFQRGSVRGDRTLDRDFRQDDRTRVLMTRARGVEKVLGHDPRPCRHRGRRDSA